MRRTMIAASAAVALAGCGSESDAPSADCPGGCAAGQRCEAGACVDDAPTECWLAPDHGDRDQCECTQTECTYACSGPEDCQSKSSSERANCGIGDHCTLKDTDTSASGGSWYATDTYECCACVCYSCPEDLRQDGGCVLRGALRECLDAPPLECSHLRQNAAR